MIKNQYKKRDSLKKLWQSGCWGLFLGFFFTALETSEGILGSPSAVILGTEAASPGGSSIVPLGTEAESYRLEDLVYKKTTVNNKEAGVGQS